MIFFLFLIPVISKPSDVLFSEQQSVLFSFYHFLPLKLDTPLCSGARSLYLQCILAMKLTAQTAL